MNKISDNMGIEQLSKSAKEYSSWALRKRMEFVNLRLDQERDIKLLYEELGVKLSQKISEGGLNKFEMNRLKALQEDISLRANELAGQLTMSFEKYLESNVELATGYTKDITIDVVKRSGITKVTQGMVEEAYSKVNTGAVEAMWTRTQGGLKISDRIWNKSASYRNGINKVLLSGVAEGEDCVTVARALERYVKKGSKTFAKSYPNMMKRMGSRIPKNLNYEALRLARTEMTASYGMATFKSTKETPGARGVKFILSDSHPVYDICDPIVDADAYGLGRGVYPLEEAPNYPFHPNCMCIMLPALEDRDTLVDRLIEWEENPNSHPDLERWYEDNYES